MASSFYLFLFFGYRSDVAEQSGELVSRSIAGSMTPRVNFGYADAHMVPRQMAAGPADWREALDIVALGLPEQSVEGMKVICHELTQAVDPESSVLDDLIKEAYRLVSCLSVMVSLHCILQLSFR
nr:protein MOR1-like [Lolium perenne]